MHGLINKAVEVFVKGTCGTEAWRRVTKKAGLGITEFEAMLSYDPSVTARTLDAMASVLSRPQEHLLEDLGTFLVTSPSLPAVRRLLRFGGITYEDFLHSLEELPDRVRLAVDDLYLPELILLEEDVRQFRLQCRSGLVGYGHAMVGVLRAMADDYGALAILNHQGRESGDEVISIMIIQDAFFEGKSFQLGAKTV